MKQPTPVLSKTFESHLWIRPEGRGTFLESPLIKEAIESAQEEGMSDFVIDLEACAGMDSTFMGMLAGLGMALQKTDSGSLTVVGTTEKTQASLKELGLQYLLTIEPDEGPWVGRLDEARAGLRPIAGSVEVDKESHIKECHEDLCRADDGNFDRFETVLNMMGSDLKKPSDQ